MYLDPAVFTAAFRDCLRHHDEICLGLQQIVRGMAKRFTFNTVDDREDVEGEALTYAIKQIPKFKFSKGGNAFTYFSSVIFNAINRELRRRSVVTRRAWNFTDMLNEQYDDRYAVVSGDRLRSARHYSELRGR